MEKPHRRTRSGVGAGARFHTRSTFFFFVATFLWTTYFAWTAVSLAIPTNAVPGAFPWISQLPLAGHGRRSVCLFAGSNRNNLSSSERERRDEEKRRQQRQDEVVPGKTSAIKGEVDFQLDPQATENEWLRQADQVEKQVFRLTDAGMAFLNSLRLQEADEAFSAVFQLRPNAYLWQAGIVKYYLGDIEAAAEIFARTAGVYETKFGGPASEERIWRDACALKYYSGLNSKERKALDDRGGRKTVVATIPVGESQEETVLSETRKVIKLSRALFSASVKGDVSTELLARARIQSIGGTEAATSRVLDRKLWKLNSWFYLGLHYDATGDFEESQKCMKMALRLCPSSGKSDDLIHTLPLLHMTVRDWFDDDALDADPFSEHPDQVESVEKFSPKPPPPSIASKAYADPVIERSIRDGVGKLRRPQLIEALRLRGLTSVGSKVALQERLFYSLMDDAGSGTGLSP